MSNRTVKYTAGDVGRLCVIKDFLPRPDTLVSREDQVKVQNGCEVGLVVPGDVGEVRGRWRG